MSRTQVLYSHKHGDHFEPHTRIRGLGGETWYRTELEVIRTMALGQTYYVTVNGHTVDIVTASHAGHRYLKTTADGYAPNNLLNLPEPPLGLIRQ